MKRWNIDSSAYYVLTTITLAQAPEPELQRNFQRFGTGLSRRAGRLYYLRSKDSRRWEQGDQQAESGEPQMVAHH